LERGNKHVGFKASKKKGSYEKKWSRRDTHTWVKQKEVTRNWTKKKRGVKKVLEVKKERNDKCRATRKDRPASHVEKKRVAE